jgi:hypothetical protein
MMLIFLYRSSRYTSLLEDRDKQLLSSPEQKKLCRNYVKELTLNPSLAKKRTFLPLLFTREGGGDELFNLFITTQPQNEEGIEKNHQTFKFFKIFKLLSFSFKILKIFNVFY